MKSTGPQFIRYFGPLLDALRELGGSGRPAEICTLIADTLKLSDKDRSAVTKSGMSRYENQVHWARYYLASAGLVDSSTRGVWALTEKGQIAHLDHESALALYSKLYSEVVADKKQATTGVPAGDSPEDRTAPTPAPNTARADEPIHYRQKLLAILLALPPAGFERICQRLLREAGFEQVIVTGRSGDGGLDGQGVLQINPLVSFKVLFQCKRYAGAVGASQVRDFRGAMMGRADKGIILTTGTFTADAQKEALRDGVPAIELVSGEKLLDMFEGLELGLRPRKTYDVDEQFFEAFRQV